MQLCLRSFFKALLRSFLDLILHALWQTAFLVQIEATEHRQILAHDRDEQKSMFTSHQNLTEVYQLLCLSPALASQKAQIMRHAVSSKTSPMFFSPWVGDHWECSRSDGTPWSACLQLNIAIALCQNLLVVGVDSLKVEAPNFAERNKCGCFNVKTHFTAHGVFKSSARISPDNINQFFDASSFLHAKKIATTNKTNTLHLLLNVIYLRNIWDICGNSNNTNLVISSFSFSGSVG